MNFDQEAVGLFLKGLSTVAAGLYTGGALYVNVVEHPARMEATDIPTALTCWKLSYFRAGSVMPKLALTTIVSSASAYFATRGTSKENIGWLVASGMFTTLFPFTKIFILPLNNDLTAVEESKEKAVIGSKMD